MLRPALVLLLLFTLLTGVAYPALVTGLGQALFAGPANGSLIEGSGSSLIGQPFSRPGYFWGRPSAVSYDAKTSGGTNLGPTNPSLHEAIASRIAALRAADPEATGAVPVDLVTASGSGLDPHLSPAGALFQVGRVARARGLAPAAVRTLVESQIEGRLFGLFGEPTVNVLRLNLALDKLSALSPERG